MPARNKPPHKQPGKKYTAAQKESILQSLDVYFLLGYSREKACVLVKFNRTTLDSWEQKDPTITMRINAEIEYANSKARENVVAAINAGDKDMSKWWLERRSKDEFSQRSEVTGAEGKPIESEASALSPEAEKQVSDTVTKALEKLFRKPKPTK